LRKPLKILIFFKLNCVRIEYLPDRRVVFLKNSFQSQIEKQIRLIYRIVPLRIQFLSVYNPT